MIKRAISFAQAMGGEEEPALRPFCTAAIEILTQRLKPGVTAQACGEVFPLAAAMLALDLMETGQGEAVKSFSAGDMAVQYAQGQASVRGRRAFDLLSPFCKGDGFAAKGVLG